MVFNDIDAPANVALAAANTVPADHPRTNGSSVSLANGFDQTNLIAGSCPGDTTIAVGGGQSVTLEFSKLCDPAGMLGNVLVAITALACVAIVFVKGS
jgi:hypothetical protein